ncbi:glycosyltransferase family 2 protein [Salibacteraceae bacterium]|nr:glycosyltransferase family 2 protein [Salibacteraceae bacterium]
MKLSVIIVNYNVRYYLENCLRSALKASVGLNVEIIVVDNASTDGSSEMMKDLFPAMEYMYLEKNIGFSGANNAGIKRSTGDYILLLNPDTVVQEDSFSSCLNYLDSNPNVGGLGVKMLDGSGTFLPESKRGLPTPMAAFYKIFGLSGIFPNSKAFGKYHLGYLNKNENHNVDVLSGAFLMMPRHVIEKVGYLDEDYFMYGEDIDLSYCITKAGFKNVYFSDTSIIHYKGESTKKDSVNYVFVFYRAMIIFARKHFDKGSASAFSALINIAIYFRAFIALIRRLIGRHWQLILDFSIIYFSFWQSAIFYESYANKDFSDSLISLLIPIYSGIFSIVLNISGSHDLPMKWIRLFRGWSAGVITLLIIYALLPESLRFSRAVLLLGSFISLAIGIVWRFAAAKTMRSSFVIGELFPSRRLVVGDLNSLSTASELLDKTDIPNDFIAGISLGGNKYDGALTDIDNLQQACRELKVQEIILDSSVAPYSEIINLIDRSNNETYQVKILNSNWIIGPQVVIKSHRYTSGNDLYNLNLKAVSRHKVFSNLLISVSSIVFLPLTIWFIDKKAGFIKNLISVILGKKGWVGYDPRGADLDLPKIKSGVIFPNQDTIWTSQQNEQAYRANADYIKSSILLSDLLLVSSSIHHLGD